MYALLDSSHDMRRCAEELGCPVRQLLTPLTGFRLQDATQPFYMDNGAFAGFNATAYGRLLAREADRKALCGWIAVPDIVGSARRTLEVWERWYPRLCSWPLAFVCQDGQEDLPIPWDLIAAVFIGGTTGWKLGPHARAIIRTATALGKWSHAGRVNTPGRFEYFARLGTTSIDGTGLARYSWMRQAISEAFTAPCLFPFPPAPADGVALSSSVRIVGAGGRKP